MKTIFPPQLQSKWYGVRIMLDADLSPRKRAYDIVSICDIAAIECELSENMEFFQSNTPTMFLWWIFLLEFLNQIDAVANSM